MKKRIGYLVIITLIFFSCQEDDHFFGSEITETTTRQQDDQLLGELYQEIVEISTQFNCSNAEEWKFTAIGSKGCGGPTGYIAYSVKTDEDLFLKKVNHYSSQQNKYNIKWGVLSTCDIPPLPQDVTCIDGVPQFVYN